MDLLDALDKVVRGRSEPRASFAIAPQRVLDEQVEGEESFLKPQASYFEIRLKQMHLRDQREYWRTFRPFTTVVSSFLHAGKTEEVPFVVGPEMLGEAVKLQDGDRVDYLNTRVAGPFPYEGDDLRLFVGLARMAVNDWAQQALAILETFAKAFDPSKLSVYLDVAGPLVSGVESFLGMQDVELRLGMVRDYQEPRGRGGLKPNSLQQRYQVELNVPDNELNQAAREKFWVKEGRLFYGSWEDTIRPYRDADFLLYQIQPLAERSDYTTFDFHRVYWQEVLKAIWDGNEKGAWQKLRLMAANLALCSDIVRPHRNLLLRMYRQQFDEELAIQQDMFSGAEVVFTRDSESLRKKVVEREQALTEDTMVEAIRAESSPQAVRRLQKQSPEDMLSELGL
jgi:hypothetical protein